MKARMTHCEVSPYDGSTTIFVDDGRALKFGRDEFRHLKQENVMELLAEHLDILGADDRVDVIQYGKKVGELPAFWSPALAKSSSFLYDYRRGDLEFKDGKWHASKTLGGGDLDCLIGFVRKPSHD